MSTGVFKKALTFSSCSSSSYSSADDTVDDVGVTSDARRSPASPLNSQHSCMRSIAAATSSSSSRLLMLLPVSLCDILRFAEIVVVVVVALVDASAAIIATISAGFEVVSMDGVVVVVVVVPPCTSITTAAAACAVDVAADGAADAVLPTAMSVAVC